MVLLAEDVGDDVGSLNCDPLGSAAPTPAKIETNQANGLASELFTTERTDGGETSRGLCDYIVGAVGTQNMTFWATSARSPHRIIFATHRREWSGVGGGHHTLLHRPRKDSRD